MREQNLLELYAANRAEIEVLRDPQALFVLGFLDSTQSATRAQLAGDLGLSRGAFDTLLGRLDAAGLVAAQGDVLVVSAAGKALLQQIGLSAPPPPPSNSTPESSSRIRPTARAGGASNLGILGLGVGAVALLLVGGFVLLTNRGRDDKTVTPPAPVTQITKPLSPTLPVTRTRAPRIDTPTPLPDKATLTPSGVAIPIALQGAPAVMVFSPRGQRLFVASVDGDKRNWLEAFEPPNPKPVQSIQLPDSAVAPQSLIAAPNGQHLYLLSYDGTVLELDAQSLKVTQKGATNIKFACARCPGLFSRDGNYLLISLHTFIAVLDVRTLEQVGTIETNGKVGQPRWTADGQGLYVPLANDVVLEYQVEFGRPVTAKQVRRIPVPDGPTDAIPSPDGRSLYVMRSGKVTILRIDLSTQTVESELRASSGLAPLVLDQSGEIGVTPFGSILFLLNTKAGTLTNVAVPSHQNLAALSADGSLAATAAAGDPAVNLVAVR